MSFDGEAFEGSKVSLLHFGGEFFAVEFETFHHFFGTGDQFLGDVQDVEGIALVPLLGELGVLGYPMADEGLLESRCRGDHTHGHTLAAHDGELSGDLDGIGGPGPLGSDARKMGIFDGILDSLLLFPVYGWGEIVGAFIVGELLARAFLGLDFLFIAHRGLRGTLGRDRRGLREYRGAPLRARPWRASGRTYC